MLPDGNVLGYQGEHNATLLTITPPNEMTECEEIAGYKIAFQLNNCRCCHSEMIMKSPSVEIPLSSQITSSKEISVQLEGYGADGNLVIKSKKVSKLIFDDSVAGTNVDYNNEEHGTAADISANTLARHTHSNADVLNEFGENEAGKPTYKGEEIGGGGAKTKTVTLNTFDHGLFFNQTGQIGMLIGCYSQPKDAEGNVLVPENAEIESISVISPTYGEVDLRQMFAIDLIPYVLHYHSQFIDNDITGYSFALFRFITGETNAIWAEINSNTITEIKVTYYT